MPPELRVHDPAGGPVWEEAWEVTEALVSALSTLADDRGAVFATVLFPDAVEATVAGRAAAVAAWPTMGGWDLSVAGDRAAEVAGRVGPVLDLRPTLATAEQPQAPLYLEEDGHWSARGHEIAAAASAPFVAALLDSAVPRDDTP